MSVAAPVGTEFGGYFNAVVSGQFKVAQFQLSE